MALWFEGKILIVRSSYRAMCSLPGGYVKSGETAHAAAMRELWEELSVRVPEAHVRHAWHGSLPFEYRTDTLDIFEAELERPFHLAPNGRELVWADWKTPGEARAMRIVPHLRAYLDEREQIRNVSSTPHRE